MAEENSLFVARESDVAVVRNLWSQAREGTPQVLRLQAPFGGGRRAVMGEFMREIEASGEEATLWRVVCLDQENGLQWLVRMYGSLLANLTTDILRRGRVEMILNSQLPTQPKRVQSWYQEFIGALKESKTDSDKGAIQLRLPRDNPLIGLVEVASAISRKQPVLLEIQNPHVVYSLALAQFVECLHAEARSHGGKLMIVLYDEPATDTTRALFPMPLLDLYDRAEGFVTHAIAPWGADEAAAFLASKGIEGDANRYAEIAGGRPGFIAELAEIAQERGLTDLSEVSFAGLVPLDVDEDELELPEEPAKEGERKHAGPDDVKQVAFFAALLGQAFPSSLVADMGGYDRDSIDDLVDELDDLFEEVQFSKELGTWIYKFKRGSWREGVLEMHDNDEGHELARKVGVFMERFLVPRGYGFIVKTARVYAEHSAYQRAALLRSVALSNDAQDVWGLAYDVINYFDEVTWPDPLRRTVYMNLLERMVGSGPVQAAETIHKRVTEWATDNEDRELIAWCLFAGSRLDARRQDFYRARDRARDALKLYAGFDNKVRQAEIHNHMAQIEVQDGNPNAAIEQIDKALELGKVEGPEGQQAYVPGILAQAEHIRGSVVRRGGKPKEAIEHFRRANEVAGQAGIAPLALDSGLAFGEALLASGEVEKARDALGRVVQIARQLQNAARERSASELLAQAEGALRNFDAALQHATRTLELTQALKFEQALPVDLYNLGFFNYALQKPTEALTFFRQAESRIASMGDHPVVKELYYFMGLANLQTGNVGEAKASLRNGLRPAQQAQDWRKLVSSLDHLAGIETQQGNPANARRYLEQAVDFAKRGNLKEEGKNLRKKLGGLPA